MRGTHAVDEDEDMREDRQDNDVDAVCRGGAGMTLGGLELSGICAVERDKEERPWIRVRNKRPSGRSMGDTCIVGDKKGNTHKCSKNGGKFEEIRITADSGAVDHVAPSDMARGIPIRETRASKQGVHYVAANGSVISCKRGGGEEDKCIYRGGDAH